MSDIEIAPILVKYFTNPKVVKLPLIMTWNIDWDCTIQSDQICLRLVRLKQISDLN